MADGFVLRESTPLTSPDSVATGLTENIGTPVHWAVLNGHVAALKTLLEMGCAPDPPKAKNHKRSSAAPETPLEMCERLYGTTEGIGLEICRLLKG